MKINRSIWKRLAVVVMSLAMIGMPAMAQGTPFNSTVQTVALNYTVNETLSITVSGGPANFVPNGPGVATTTNIITVTPVWLINTGHLGVDIVGYFSSTHALSSTSGGSVNVNSVSAATTGTNSVGAVASFNQTVDGQTNAALLYHNSAPGTTNAANDVLTFTMSMSASTTGGLVPGIYTGTLNLVAQAN